MSTSLTRREALALAAAVASCNATRSTAFEPTAAASSAPPPRDYLTPADKFADVSRGNPIPHTLTGDALIRARLTPETWRLEISASDRDDAKTKATLTRSLSIADGSALDFPTLLKLGQRHGVRFLKAMQCQNIACPLGQGLWEGVRLRVVLDLCGKISAARRLFFWGYHNDKPEQRFQSSLSLSQALDGPAGDLPAFLAYRLNGAPIPLNRGGPVRMVVPWAHGFKSIKWLQHIVLTNDYRANDTYAEDGNDPESFLKTAAYFDDVKPLSLKAGAPVEVAGAAVVGWPGLERTEYWLRPDAGAGGKLADDDPAWSTAQWRPVPIDPPPTNWSEFLPVGVSPQTIWGFDGSGVPKEWPMRYSIARWRIILPDLASGKYELRVRTIDKNGFAQPAPRPVGLTGHNQIQCKLIRIQPRP